MGVVISDSDPLSSSALQGVSVSEDFHQMASDDAFPLKLSHGHVVRNQGRTENIDVPQINCV
jgi:predicted nucleotide-binding protein (sugar kinase/HSP70/actin superfamily)